MGVIDEVKQKTDIIEVIGQHTKLTKAGRTFRGLCPFHSEKHASFFVYPEQQSWHCFGACNTGGDVFSFLMKKDGVSFGEALRLLAQKTGVTIPSSPGQDEGKAEREKLYQVNESAALYFHDMLLKSPAAEKARNYMVGRGFSQKTLADFQLGFSPDSWESLKQHLLERGYSPELLLASGLIIDAENGKTHDRFRGRLMFPIRDARGHVLGFGARVLDDSLPKYINSPQTPLFDKSSILYGLDLAAAAIRQQDMAVIMEGYIDVITAHQNNINNVVASMGTSVTEKQVSALKKLTRNLVLALDADAAGEEAMLRGITHENTLDAEVRVVILPEGKDPDDVIREDPRVWPGLVEKSVPILDYTFNMVTVKLDLTTARDKSLTVERLAPFIAEIKNPVRQAHYLQKLARLVRTNERTIETVINKIRSGADRQKPSAARQETITRILHPLMSDPLEEYCLALLLQHPELRSTGDLSPEYFEHSENREIFTAWQQTGDVAALKGKVDAAIHEHLDALMSRSLPSPNGADQKYADFSRRLKEKYLKNLEAKRADKFASEAESKGSGADLARLEEAGIETAVQLKEIFAQRNQRRR